MKHRLQTQAGKNRYALRKSTVEPVIGIVKSVMDFRQFSLRGRTKVKGEWNLMCLAYSVFGLQPEEIASDASDMAPTALDLALLVHISLLRLSSCF